MLVKQGDRVIYLVSIILGILTTIIIIGLNWHTSVNIYIHKPSFIQWFYLGLVIFYWLFSLSFIYIMIGLAIRAFFYSSK